MGNDVMERESAAQKTAGSPLGVTPSPAVHEVSEGLPMMKSESLFSSLMENFRDAFFPKKLPPLELTSKPIPVVDKMAVKRDPVSAAIATGIHIVLGALVIYLSYHIIKTTTTPPPKDTVLTDVDIKTPPPLHISNGGGGGGSNEATPASKGVPPPMAKTVITPPTTHKIDNPALAVPSTSTIPTMASNMNIGAVTGLGNNPSNGPGHGAGIGSGSGNGVGSGKGSGSGPCSADQGCYGVSGVDSPPVPISQPRPDYSEEARKAKQQGIVLVCMWVTAAGTPSHLYVAQPLGFGLDEEALKSAATWKFRPAMKGGKPVTVSDVCANINFRLY